MNSAELCLLAWDRDSEAATSQILESRDVGSQCFSRYIAPMTSWHHWIVVQMTVEAVVRWVGVESSDEWVAGTTEREMVREELGLRHLELYSVGY